MQIREAVPRDTRGIARVHVNAWRATYRGIVPDHVLENLSYQRQEQFWQDQLSDLNNQTIILVADHPQVGVVGFASAGPERTGKFPFKSELYTIYMLKAYQGRGLGRQLMSAIAGRLLVQGTTSMLVWVLRDNLFRAFYETLGGREVGEQEITMGEATLVEVAYGWEDIRSLAIHDSPK